MEGKKERSNQHLLFCFRFASFNTTDNVPLLIQVIVVGRKSVSWFDLWVGTPARLSFTQSITYTFNQIIISLN